MHCAFLNGFLQPVQRLFRLSESLINRSNIERRDVSKFGLFLQVIEALQQHAAITRALEFLPQYDCQFVVSSQCQHLLTMMKGFLMHFPLLKEIHQPHVCPEVSRIQLNSFHKLLCCFVVPAREVKRESNCSVDEA